MALLDLDQIEKTLNEFLEFWGRGSSEDALGWMPKTIIALVAENRELRARITQLNVDVSVAWKLGHQEGSARNLPPGWER